jgi:RND family efflux transporter MFP subunit
MHSKHLLVCLFVSLNPFPAFAQDDGHPVRIADVEVRPIVRTVSTYGVLAPKIEDLSFRINGRIATFGVTEGETVEENQVLAELEKRDAEDSLNQARVQRDQSARQLERFQKLAAERMIQDSQLEDALDNMETAQIKFDQAELELTRCTLRAPAKGVILKEYLDSRTTITAGTPIYSFRDISKSWVTEVELTDQNAFAFGLGTTALARFAPYPGEAFNGTLTKQAGVADENDGLYTVEITIAAKGRELRPGMVVEIDLIHETEESFSMVPLDAMVDLRSNRGVIYLLKPSGDQVVEQAVHIIAIAGGQVALLEPIPKGAKVVIRGQQSLRDNSSIRIL